MTLLDGLFKRKSKTPPALAFTQARGLESIDDTALLVRLRHVVEGQPPIVPAMCLIAYENVFLLNSIFEQATRGIPNCTPSLANIARWLEQRRAECTSSSIEDEANRRRYFYLYLAVLLSIAHARAKERPALRDRLADVWLALLPGAAALRTIIDTTQLWSPSETAFFCRLEDGQGWGRVLFGSCHAGRLTGAQNNYRLDLAGYAACRSC